MRTTVGCRVLTETTAKIIRDNGPGKYSTVRFTEGTAMEDLSGALVALILIGGAAFAMVYAIALQRRAMRKQSEAIVMAQESIDRQARALEIAEQSVSISEKMLVQLQEINRKTR
jgi:hypothetical protein